MRLLYISVLSLLLCNISFAQVNEIHLSKKGIEHKSISNSKADLRFLFSHDKILSNNLTSKDGHSYSEIWIKGSYPNGEIGTPKIPAYKKLIVIPRGSKPVICVVSYSEQLITLKDNGINSPIYPNQASVQKNQDPSKIKFEIKKSAYAKSSFSNSPIATIEVLGNLRSETIARLVVNPVDYNPGEGLIKVYNDIDVEVSFNNQTDSDNQQDILKKTYSPYFDAIYKSLEGSSKSSYTDHPDLSKYPVKMLIISNRMFEQSIQPFIEWKRYKGFNVKTVYTDVIGTTAEQIKTYIQQEYNSATPENPAPTFLLIVGDVGQVAASANGSQTYRSTDLYYASVDGDMFPDMYYGRLSATTTDQLDNIISKIIYYEKYKFEDPSYLNNVTLIAGADASWNPKVGQPTIKYATANYYKQSKGFVSINEYGVASDPNNPTANAGYIGCYGSDKISAGLVNYTAHGSETSWVEPSLTTSSIEGFSNLNKYPIAIGNCCLSGDFGYSECLGEAWIRAQNKGAVTYIGSSPNTFWLEDFYWAVGAFPMVGENNGYVPSFQETTTGMYDAPFVSNYVTTGGMVFAGNLAVTEVDIQGYPNSSSPTYYWEAYNILGDPSLMPYFTEAETNQVYHSQTITVGETSFTVNALNNSYIAISKDNQLIGTSFVDKTGDVSIPLTQISSTGDVVIVITRPQTKPYIDTITAISPTGPYLKLDAFSIDDHLANNNNRADYNELFDINLQVKNIGIQNATNVRVKIIGSDENISIQSNDSIKISDIPYNNGVNSIAVNNAFSFKTQENIPDQYTANFTLKFFSDQGSWTSALRVLLNSPVLKLEEVKVDDSALGGNNDSLLSPGEIGKAIVKLVNTGHSKAKNISFQISIPDSAKNNISISEIQIASFSLDANSFNYLPFRISVNPTLHQEYTIPISVKVIVGEPSIQSATYERYLKVIPKESVNILNDTLKTCFSYFYDSGGNSGNYKNSENYTISFVAQNESSFLKAKFVEFATESGYDFLYVYDGSSITSPQVSGSPFSGSNLPSQIISSGRCLTFRFISDDNTINKGWKATIECIDSQIPNCVTSLSPENGATKVQSGILNWTSQTFATFYNVFLGPSSTALSYVSKVEKPEFTFKPEKSKVYYWQIVPGNYLGTNTNNCNTWSFSTDTICSQILMSTNTVLVDTILFYDSGGPLHDYKNNENYTLTLKPKYAGNLLNIRFLSFDIEGQSSCSYDKLTIYDGLTTSSPIIGSYCNTSLPSELQATNTDGALTFTFHSDNSDAFGGWKAIVKSIGAATFKTITIKVQNNSTPISNASINIGGVIKQTDTNGFAHFTVMSTGNLGVNVSALGYQTLNTIITEAETNSTITLDLKKLNTVNIHVFNIKTLKPIEGLKVKVASDSAFTNSLGKSSLYLVSGVYTLYLSINGYKTYSQQLIVGNGDLNLEVPLTAIKYRVSFIIYDDHLNKINDAQISISDTILKTNSEGGTQGYFSMGNYPTTISKEQYSQLSTWVLVNDTITKKVYLDATTSLFGVDFSVIGKGPKGTLLLNNNDISIYLNNIIYSKLTTDNQGKSSSQLPSGSYTYSIAREGYNSIINKPLVIGGIKTVKDTLLQKTFPVQFNVSSSTSSVEDAIVTLTGYPSKKTNLLGQASFTTVGYEKKLHYTIKGQGFNDASGDIDVITPLVLNITLVSTEEPTNTKNHAKIFPNPTSDQLLIEADQPITNITVINTLGVVIQDNMFSHSNRVKISMGNLTSGVYILIIRNENSILEKALVIKK